MIALLLAGCAGDLTVDAAFLRLSGEVSPEVTLEGTDPELHLVWVTSVDGQACVEVDPLVIEPEILAYQVEILGPPSLEGEPCVPLSIGSGPIGLGVLALVDPEPGGDVQVSADPSSLVDWFAGSGVSLGDVLVTDGGRLAGRSEAALIVAADPSEPDPDYCRFGAVVPGLALYADRGLGCDGWVALAAAGERTEFQGVDLLPP